MMKSSMIVVLVAVLFVSFASAQSRWSTCDGVTNAITVTSVTLNPDPVVLGTDNTVTLNATIPGGRQLTGGNVHLTITYYGFLVFTNDYDICATNACPQGPDVSAAIVVLGTSLPVGAPPGNYVGTATITDTAGNQLACVNVDFTV